MQKKKLAIVSSHPIQYNAPLFKLLSQRGNVAVKVYYTWGEGALKKKFDPGFSKFIEWDIPLLEGYEYEFVENISKDPGSHHFKGIINRGLNQQIEKWGADAVLVIGWSFASHLKCMRYFKGKIPVLFRGDSTLLNEQSGVKKWLRRIFLKWVYRNIDYALFVGENNRQYFIKHGLKERQLLLAPHAIDNDRFGQPDTTYNQVAEEWRQKLGITRNDVVLLFAGKLEPIKNPFFILEIAKRIESSEFKVIFVGNGVLEQSLKEAAANDPRIMFMDFQNQLNMPVVYRTADLLILPSHSETWGLAANEAMACGCAIMMSDKTGGAIDLIPEGKNGVIFKVNDVQKCTEFINYILANRNVLKSMRLASRQLITNFSFERIVLEIEHLCAS